MLGFGIGGNNEPIEQRVSTTSFKKVFASSSSNMKMCYFVCVYIYILFCCSTFHAISSTSNTNMKALIRQVVITHYYYLFLFNFPISWIYINDTNYFNLIVSVVPSSDWLTTLLIYQFFLKYNNWLKSI